MPLEISNVGQVAPTQATNIQTAKNEKMDLNTPNDSYEFTRTNESKLSKEEKQEIVKKAKTKAAGWSILFGIFSTAYYSLRSDKKVAKQFDLDVNTDKKLIKQIKNEQLKSTLPSVLGSLCFGIGALLTGGIAWIYNKNSDASKINVD